MILLVLPVAIVRKKKSLDNNDSRKWRFLGIIWKPDAILTSFKVAWSKVLLNLFWSETLLLDDYGRTILTIAPSCPLNISLSKSSLSHFDVSQWDGVNLIKVSIVEYRSRTWWFSKVILVGDMWGVTIWSTKGVHKSWLNFCRYL